MNATSPPTGGPAGPARAEDATEGALAGAATGASGSALLTNAVGLHARPSVKLTQLAKSFAAAIEVGLGAEGPWVDAKSPVKIMRVKAGKGTVLHFRAEGPDAGAAIAALVALVERRFDEEESGQGEAPHGETPHGETPHGETP